MKIKKPRREWLTDVLFMPINWFQGGTTTLDSTKQSTASGSINVWTVLKKGSRLRHVEEKYDFRHFGSNVLGKIWARITMEIHQH